MKAHIGVDSRSKLIHSVEATAANVHDSRVLEKLLHGKETRVGGFGVCRAEGGDGQGGPGGRDWTQRKGHRYRKLTERERAQNRCKSRVRARVEHQFGIVKLRFGFTKVRYGGLAKNAHRLVTACALSNLVMVKKASLRRCSVTPRPQYA